MMLRWSAPFVPLLADDPRIDRGEPEQVEASARYRTIACISFCQGCTQPRCNPPGQAPASSLCGLLSQ